MREKVKRTNMFVVQKSKNIAPFLVIIAFAICANGAKSQNEIFPIDSQEEIAWVQETLKLIGYECGPTDGVMGPSTRSCIRSLQRENGLRATGSMGRETYEEMIRALLSPQSEKGVFARSGEQAEGDQPESQPDSTEVPRETARKEPKSAEGPRDQESDDQPPSSSQTQTTSKSQSRSKFEVSPYIGYNTAGGYSVDFQEAIDIAWDPEDDDGSDIASSQGGIVVGVGGSVALSEQGSFSLRLRPSIEMTLISDQSESVTSLNGVGFTLGSSQQYFQVSGDVIARFKRGDSFTPYAGGGLTYVSFSGELIADDIPEPFTEEEFFRDIDAEEFGAEDGEVDGSSIGFNIVGGVRLNDVADFGVPYAQLRLSLVDPRTDSLTDLDAPTLNPAITLSGGVSFGN